MQAYAEGFELMHKSEYALDIEQIADLWNQGSVVRSWLLRAGRSARSTRRATTSRDLEGYVDDSGEGRWTIDRRDRPRRADAGAHRLAVRALLLTRRRRLLGPGARGAAQPVRRARGQDGAEAVRRPCAADRGRRREPAGRGPRAPAGPPDHAGDLRRHRRPRPPQAAAGALQPRPRGRAARALRADRRVAGATRTHEDFRDDRARSRSSGSRAAARRRTCSRACSTTCATSRARSTTTTCYARARRRRSTSSTQQRGHAAQPRLLPVDRAASSSR